MDNQSYKRLQKMLMHGTSSIEEDDREEEIESEPPRWATLLGRFFFFSWDACDVHVCACMHMHVHFFPLLPP